MTEKEIERYIKKVERFYRSIDAKVISCIRTKCDDVAKGKWIDVMNYSTDEDMNIGEYEFKEIIFRTFEKTIKPKYPKVTEFSSEKVHRKVCDGILLEACERDIMLQEAKGIKGEYYVFEGELEITDAGERKYTTMVVKY